MFVDASVIVAVLAREPGWADLLQRLGDYAGDLRVSPLVQFESVTAVARVRSGKLPVTPEAVEQADKAVTRFLREIGAEVIDLTADIASESIAASARYGKLVGHPARLNLGDCFAYACAKSLGVPLLYKGNDFAKTDLA